MPGVYMFFEIDYTKMRGHPLVSGIRTIRDELPGSTQPWQTFKGTLDVLIAVDFRTDKKSASLSDAENSQYHPADNNADRVQSLFSARDCPG